MSAQRFLFEIPRIEGRLPIPDSGLRVAGLFAGIGGIELGFHRAGHSTELFCEIDAGAIEVLSSHFANVPIETDVTKLLRLPSVDLVTAGFPCQDLSQAGATGGINGSRSGLVEEVFRLLRTSDVPLLLLENVPFMLQLQRGRALEFIVSELEKLGFAWAYRVIDSRFTGIPQRRERVYLLASRQGDPRSALLGPESDSPRVGESQAWWEAPCGFYWTEGIRGLGWAFDAVPTLKGGSTLGIPSPPAIIFPSGKIAKPDVRDAERLQGFEPDWTKPAEKVARAGHRWKLIGNAVTVDVAEWIARRISSNEDYDFSEDKPLSAGSPWPRAAWGVRGKRFVVDRSTWPALSRGPGLASFLKHDVELLSVRAATGFFDRTRRGSLRFPPRFLSAIEEHIKVAS